MRSVDVPEPAVQVQAETAAGAVLERIRRQPPVQCLTDIVVTAFTANAL